MKIESKPPELLAAQLAAYAAEHNENTADRNHLIVNAGSIVVAESLPEGGIISREIPVGEKLVKGSEKEEPRIAADRESYTAFLREKGGARNKDIAYRAKLLRNFDQFRSVIEEQSAEGLEKLGHGGSSEVSIIQVADGTPYALRRMHYADSEDQIDDHMLAASRVQLMPEKYRKKVENIVAATYENGGMTIAPIVPGKPWGEVSKEELQAVTDEQVEDFVGTIVAAGDVGIGFDPSKKDNFFLDSKEGFGVVDLHAATADGHVVQASTVLKLIPNMISSVGRSTKVLNSIEDYADAGRQAAASIPFLEAYQRACAKLPDSILDAETKNKIATEADDARLRARQFGDSEWAAEKIKQYQQRNNDDNDLV